MTSGNPYVIWAAVTAPLDCPGGTAAAVPFVPSFVVAANPKFATEANRQIDAVGDNGIWFKGYRKDAMQAVGR